MVTRDIYTRQSQQTHDNNRKPAHGVGHHDESHLPANLILSGLPTHQPVHILVRFLNGNVHVQVSGYDHDESQ